MLQLLLCLQGDGGLPPHALFSNHTPTSVQELHPALSPSEVSGGNVDSELTAWKFRGAQQDVNVEARIWAGCCGGAAVYGASGCEAAHQLSTFLGRIWSLWSKNCQKTKLKVSTLFHIFLVWHIGTIGSGFCLKLHDFYETSICIKSLFWKC